MTTDHKLYAERDITAQGAHYGKHVNAMTAEGLHAKSDIAAELAHRDMEIDRLRNLIESFYPDIRHCLLLWARYGEARDKALAATERLLNERTP